MFAVKGIFFKAPVGTLSDIYGRSAALLAAALVFGLGESMVTSSAIAMVAEMTRTRGHGTSMGIFGSLWDIGHAAGPIATGFLLTNLDCLPSFGVISAVLLMAAVAFQVLVREPRKLKNA
jgi:MFS family permease